MARARDRKTGKFCSPSVDRMATSNIGLRLPLDMKEELQQVAGNQMSDWIREAIAEKLTRERQVSA